MNANDMIFVDTNILVYAHDKNAGEKYIAAKKSVEVLWEMDFPPSISVQVLQELYVNVIKRGLTDKEAENLIKDYLNWDVIDNDQSLFLEGVQERNRWKVSLWDGLIIAAARRAKASILWSEDLGTNQNYGGLLVQNPLLSIEH